MSHVRIVMTDHGRGQVFIDGHNVPGVQSVFFDASAEPGRRNSVLLTLTSRKVEIEGAAEVDPLTDLLALAHKFAGECSECGGSGEFRPYVGNGEFGDVKPCPDCADIRAVIAKAEGRA